MNLSHRFQFFIASSSKFFSLQQFLIFHDDTSRWFTKHKFRVWSKLQIWIFDIICNLTFSLILCGGIKIKLIPLYCSHFQWPEIQHADVSRPTLELIIFWSSYVDFPHFLENTREAWPQIWHVDVFWPPSEQIRVWSRYVDMPHLGAILTWCKSNLVSQIFL